MGFSRKSRAPSWVARTAVSMVPCPDIMRTGSPGRGLEELLEHGQAVQVRQPHVHEHRVHRAGERDLQPELAGAGELGVVAGQLQRLAQREEDVLLVVDEEDAVRHHRTPASWPRSRNDVAHGPRPREFLLTDITA